MGLEGTGKSKREVGGSAHVTGRHRVAMGSFAAGLAVAAMSFLACVTEPVARGAETVRGISLEGTRPGPTGFYMTTREREQYKKRINTDPKENKRFTEVIQRAAEFVEGRNNNSLDCARAYLVTGEKKYLDAARSHLVYCANWWLNSCGANPEKRYRIGAGWVWGPKIGYVADLDAPKVYDLVAADLDPESEKLIRAYMKSAIDGMREWAEDDTTLINEKTCPTWRQGQTTNMASMTYSNWSPFAFAIGYDDMIEWVIDHKRKPKARRDKGGLKQWITGNLLDHAIWCECPVYHHLVGSSVARVAEWAAGYDGRDVWAVEADDGTVARDVMDGRIALAYPLERNGIGRGAFRIATYGEGLLGFTYGAQYLVNGALGPHSRWEPVLRSIHRATGESGYG